MGKKKKSKKRGSREHGRGRKKGRGAGIRGGRGNAGSDGHRKTQIHKEHGTDYFGRDTGFTRPDAVVEETAACNVGDLARLIDELDEDGHVDRDGDTITVDLDEAGYDKLLGAGRVHHTFAVRVKEATDKALEKIEANDGAIEILQTEEDAPEDGADEPSDE